MVCGPSFSVKQEERLNLLAFIQIIRCMMEITDVEMPTLHVGVFFPGCEAPNQA